MFLPHGLTADVVTAAVAVDRPGPAPGPMSFEEAFPTLGKASPPSATNLNLNLNFKTAVQKNVPAAQSLAQSQQSLAQQSQQSQSLVLNHRLRTNMFMFPQRHERREYYEHDDHNDPYDDNDNGCSEGAYDSAYTKYYND